MPNSIEMLAPAKINLCLDIVKKDPSGYHQIQTVICDDYSIADKVKIKIATQSQNKSTLKLLQKNEPKRIFDSNDNLVIRAAELMRALSKRPENIEITIEKNIPHASGLGGSSSNAAAVLKGLNLWELNLSPEELSELAAQLGMDVPFFIYGGTALCTHYGEKITPLPTPKSLKIKILPPDQWPQHPHDGHEKTALSYANLDLSKCGLQTTKTEALIEAIHNDDAEAIAKNLHNDFETLIAPPQGTHLSGSGPALFVLQ